MSKSPYGRPYQYGLPSGQIVELEPPQRIVFGVYATLDMLNLLCPNASVGLRAAVEQGVIRYFEYEALVAPGDWLCYPAGKAFMICGPRRLAEWETNKLVSYMHIVTELGHELEELGQEVSY